MTDQSAMSAAVDMAQEIIALKERNRVLERELTESQKDGMRLDWLEERQALLNTAGDGRPHVNVDQNDSLNDANHFFGGTYREAIDAALAQSHEGKS